VWIQQEVYLSPIEHTVLESGEQRLSWDKVVLAGLTLHHFYLLATKQGIGRSEFPEQRRLDANNQILGVVKRMVMTCRNSYHQIWPHDPSTTLQYNLIDRLGASSLSLSTRLEATLPVDFVYSTFGICADRESVEDAVPINYDESTALVYTKTAQYLLQRVGGLVLGFAGCQQTESIDDAMPSRFPNWSAGVPRVPLCWRADIHDASTAPFIYSACGPSRDLPHTVTDTKLRVRGAVVDFIDDTGLRHDLFPALSENEISLTEWKINWMISFRIFQMSGAVGHVDDLADVLWRIPIADQEHNMVTNTPLRASTPMRANYDLFMGSIIGRNTLRL
jgi:hypothetical protein